MLEPAVIGIYDLPVGSDLQIVDDGESIRVVDTATGDTVATRQFYLPPQYREADEDSQQPE